MQITNAIKGKANEEQRRKENIDMLRRSQKIPGKVKRWDRRTDYKKDLNVQSSTVHTLNTQKH
jgi:hypothetical protein